MNFAGMLCARELFDESREFIMVKISLRVIGIRKRFCEFCNEYQHLWVHLCLMPCVSLLWRSSH